MRDRRAYWRAYYAANRERIRARLLKDPLLPIEPLRLVLSARPLNLSELARHSGVSRRELIRTRQGQQRGVRASFADKVCRALGLHPVEVWPRDWCAVGWEAIA